MNNVRFRHRHKICNTKTQASPCAFHAPFKASSSPEPSNFQGLSRRVGKQRSYSRLKSDVLQLRSRLSVSALSATGLYRSDLISTLITGWMISDELEAPRFTLNPAIVPH